MKLFRAIVFFAFVIPSATGCFEDRTPKAVFERDVVPVLNARCASTVCHGAPSDWKERGDVVEWEKLNFLVDASGDIVDVDGAYVATKRAINTDEKPEFSTFLRKLLPRAYDGLPHFGKANFASPDDAGYRAILAWIELESDGGEKRVELDELERFFAANVQPALVSANCMNGNCHSLEAAIPFRLDPGVGGEFPSAATRANYRASRTMLSLDGAPLESRLIRKGLQLHEGGIVHKGGNTVFFTALDDPRVEAIADWACRERSAELGAPCLDANVAPVAGFVFVRGPIEARNTFDLDSYLPGSDIFFARAADLTLVPQNIENLTEGLHTEPADVRDPAIDPTGAKMAFSMRTSRDLGHDLYELDLGTRAVRRLTEDARPLPGGGMLTNRDPTYGPDGTLWFVSTRAGVTADSGRMLDADLYEMDLATRGIRRRTYTPHVERKPIFFVYGEENGGEVAVSSLRDAIGPQARGHSFRFPPGLATEYHQHFGITPVENLFYDIRELPDGRYATIVGDLDNVWQSGRLAIIERNFGPEIPAYADQKPGMPFYSAPLVRLDPEATSKGATHGTYRDPVALPDGRLLVSYAAETATLSDAKAVFDFRIDLIELAEALEGAGPRIASRSTLADAEGLADYDPEPVYLRRAPPHDENMRWNPEAPTGVFLHNGFFIIEALLRNLPPSGVKTMTPDFRFIRFVEVVGTTPNERHAVPAPETRDGLAKATNFSLGAHPPARILAEFPMEDDGSFQLEIPAGTAYRLQGLDENRIAIGTMHNRWYDMSPGQKLVQGAGAGAYNQRCAACHGARDGNPSEAFGEPDVLTGASFTLARYERQNPRKPRVAPLAGADTRIEVDFVRDVRPILDAKCAVGGCHVGATPAAGLDLAGSRTTWFDAGYESLLADGEGSRAGKRYVDEPTGSAYGSYLVEKLSGRELGAPRALDAPGRSHPDPSSGHPALSSDELLTLTRWIDLGATFKGRVGE